MPPLIQVLNVVFLCMALLSWLAAGQSRRRYYDRLIELDMRIRDVVGRYEAVQALSTKLDRVLPILEALLQHVKSASSLPDGE